MHDYILDYYQQIKDGRQTVGKWVLIAYETIINGLRAKEFYLDLKKADHAIRWIQTHCFHTEGDLAPNRLTLELWQKAFLSVVFGIVDEKGSRHFKEFLLVIGRKNGKTLLSAGIARYIWETGGYGTRVYNVAPKLDQAKLLYDSVWNMTLLDPDYQERRAEIEALREQSHGKVDDSDLEKHRNTDLYIASQNSTMMKIAFNAKKSDGFNPSLTVCDEVAAWEGSPGLKQYEVIKSGMGARADSFLLSCTTAGYINDGIYDELVKRSTRFLLGESKERRLFPLLYMIDDIEKWNDINELRKSNPNLGVSVSVDYLLEEIAIAEQSLSKKAEFICKYCCLKQNSSQAWLDAQTVEKAISESLRLEDFQGCYAVMGIDLSRTTDLTCATLVIERDGVLHVFARFYLPREKIEEATARDGLPYKAYIQRGFLYESGDNFIDYRDIVEWVRQLITEYRIYPLMIGYDKYSASYMVQELKDGGCRVDDVFQGTNLTPIIRLTEGMLKDGRIKIGDNDLLKIHFLNSALKTDAENGRVKLIKMAQTAHVDGMAAFLDAMTVRDKWWPEIGAQLLNERR